MPRCFCQREARYYYYQAPKTILKVHCCSLRCLDIANDRMGVMIDPTEHEIVAIMGIADPAGQYIEQEIGNTDIGGWTHDQWLGFLECVVTLYSDKLRELASDEVPF